MARIGGWIHSRCSSEVVENSDSNNIRPCLEEFHVLAVDDSFVDRKVIERLLKISSCKVTVVESGKRALQFLGLDEEKGSSVGCNGMKVHLIITDYSMPGMTGYELLKKIKESSTFKEVPVVIMSSENILTRIDRCLQEGAKDYLVKPVKLADVKHLKEFMQGDSQAAKEKSNASLILNELHDLPSPISHPSLSSAMDFNPIINSYPCTSTKCVCISKRSRFRSRSSKYRSGLSLY